MKRLAYYTKKLVKKKKKIPTKLPLNIFISKRKYFNKLLSNN